MRLNLLDLHNPQEDDCLRKCLRAYTVLPKYCAKPDHKNWKAVEIVEMLQRADLKLRAELGSHWRKKWERKIGYPIKEKTSEEWIRGRAAIPLIAIKALERLGCKKEATEILKKTEYVSSTTGEIVRIPDKLSPAILCLSGLILGDGSLLIKIKLPEKTVTYEVSITSGNKDFLEKDISPLFKKTFETNRVSMRFSDHLGSAWTMAKRNKAIFRFFSRIMELATGNKSAKAKIPPIIEKQPKKELAPFIAGLVDSDIGKHGSGMGATFKSKEFVENLIALLKKCGIKAKHYGSHYKEGKYLQHDFTIPKHQIIQLKGLLEKTYLPKRADRLKTLYALAGVPKRTKGHGSGRYFQII